MACRFRTPHSEDAKGEEQDSCSHPKVMADAANKDRKLPDGTIEVDYDDWCRLFEKEDGEDNMASKGPLSDISKGIERKGTSGVFSEAAKRAGKTTYAYAQEHKHSKGLIGQRARLALTFMSNSK